MGQWTEEFQTRERVYEKAQGSGECVTYKGRSVRAQCGGSAEPVQGAETRQEAGAGQERV